MKKLSTLLKGEGRTAFEKNLTTIVVSLIMAIIFLMPLHSKAQQFWRTDGTTGGIWSSSTYWSPNGGPATATGGSAWTLGNNAEFSANSTLTFGTTTVGNVTVDNGVTATVTAGGTLSTGGVIRTYNIGTGSLLTWTTQTITAATSVGFDKTGAGTWNLGAPPASAGYSLGFTLDAGTVIATGNAAFGTGTLTINGGTISSTGTRAFTNPITVGGNFSIAGTGNPTYSGNMALGGSVHTITLGTTTVAPVFSGIISNTAGGITYSSITGSAALFAITGVANTYTGTTTITGDGTLSTEVSVAGDLSLGAVPGSVTANSIVLDGGRLTLASAFTLNANRGIQIGATAGTSINGGGGTINGIIADKPGSTGTWAKQGNNTLILGGANTYSGATSVNNGTVQLATSSGANRLPIGTTLNIGASGKTCVFDLNGNNQQVAGLVSVASTSNTITTTSTASVLTIGGSGTYLYGGGVAPGIISGAANMSVVMSGSGTQTLSSANTFTGGLTISNGKVEMGVASALAATLPVTLSGGTFSTGASAGFTQSVGQLNLTASSTINLGLGPHTLTFASSNATWTGELTIKGWQGASYSAGNAAGTAGRIIFTSTTNVDVTHIRFFDGTNYYPAVLIAGNEIVPVATQVTNVGSAQPTAANIQQGAADQIIGAFSVATSNANFTSSVSAISLTTAGSYGTNSSDFTNFKFWLSSSASSISGATQLGTTQSSVASGSPVSISGATASAGNSFGSTTMYILVTASVSASANVGDQISLVATPLTNFTFIGTSSGSTPIHGGDNAQSIIVSNPTNLIITNVSPANPIAGQSFTVTIQSQTGGGVASNVGASTNITLSTTTGGETLGGATPTGNISMGAFQATISGVNLSPSASGVNLTIHQTSGTDVLADGTTSINVLATTPTAPSAIVFGTATSTTIPITSWTQGNGASEIVVARLTSTTAVPPTNGTSYSVTTPWSFTGPSNATTGTGNVVIFNGAYPGSSTVTNLTSGTSYSFDIYDYNGAGVLTSYSTAATNTTSTTTPGYYWNGANPQTVGTLNVTANGGTGTWTTTGAWVQPSSPGTAATWATANKAIFGGTKGVVTIPDATTEAPTESDFNVTDYTITTPTTTGVLNGPIVLGNNIVLNLINTPTVNTTLGVGGNITGGSNSSINIISNSTVTSRVNMSTASKTISVPITISGTGTGLAGIDATASGEIISNTITNNSTASTLLGATSGNSLTVNGVISGTPGIFFAAGGSGGAGSLTLGAANQYLGSTTLNAATTAVMKLGVDNALPATPVIFGSSASQGGILDLNGTTESIGSLSTPSATPVGTITNTSTTSDATFTITQAADLSFALPITKGTTRDITLIKAGSGTLTLTSTAHTFSKGLTINAGELRFNPTGSLNLGTCPVTIGGTGGTAVLGTTGYAGGTLSFGALTLTDDATILLDGSNGHQILFAASNLTTWTSGKTLIIKGWVSSSGNYDGFSTGAVGLIYFGSDNTGLTSDQLAQIKFQDGSGILHNAVWSPNGDGEIIADAAPTVVFDPTTVTFPNASAGSTSAGTTVTLTAANLSSASNTFGTLTATAPSADFQVSSDDNPTWASSTGINYSNSGNTISNLYVRFTPQAGGNKSGNVSVTGGGLTGSADLPVSGIAYGTYTWNVSSGNWSAPGSWSPNLTEPSSGDILIFDGTRTGTATPVVTVDATPISIGQIILEHGINATFSVGANQTITINGDGTTTPDFLVNGGTTLNVVNTAASVHLTTTITTGNTGEIDGTVNFDTTVTSAATGAHTLQSADANSLKVNGTVAVGQNFSGNLFGITNLNSVEFTSGATYVAGGGSNPFGAAVPNSVVIFDNNSNFKFTAGGTTTPSIANRVYPNFEYNAPNNTATTFTNATNTGIFTGNLLISGGTFKSTGNAGIYLSGNLTVNPGATFNYSPAAGSPNRIVLNGSSDQTITNNGTFTVSTGKLILSKPSGNLVLGSDLTLDSVAFNSTNNANAANVVIGTHTLTLLGAITGTSSTAETLTPVDFTAGTITLTSDAGTNGTITGSSASSLTINDASGTTAGTLYFTSGSQVLKDLILKSNTVATLGNPLAIIAGSGDSVAVKSGATLNTGGFLTLKSGASGTARVGVSAGTISGDVTVERYIPADGSRAWRILSVPTHHPTLSIFDTWQNGGNYALGKGTMITTSGSTSGTGFDAVTLATSIETFNPSTNVWDDLTSTLGPINSSSSIPATYAIYVRGDRNATPLNGTINATTLSTTGSLYETGGSVTIPITPTPANFGLVGNPFASAIDFNHSSIQGQTSSGFNTSTFYVWDPSLLMSGSLGHYNTIHGASWIPAFDHDNSTSNYTPATAHSTIESGEAFFVETDNSGGGNHTIDITQASKMSGTQEVFRPATPTPESISVQLRTSLYTGTVSSTTLDDANIEEFNSSYSNAVDNNDALKLANTTENFAILREGKALVIEGRQPVATTDTIFFDMWNMKQQQYQLKFTPANLNTQGMTAYLKDNYLGTSTAIDLTNGSTATFTITANAGSSASNRFLIVFNNSNPVPVTFTNINAYTKNTSVAVNWQVAGEIGIKQYVVERSTDGINFIQAGVVTAKGNSSSALSYSWTDASPVNGNNFYRVMSVGVSGEVKYSSIVKVAMGSIQPGIAIYPNPVTGGKVGLQLTNQPAGSYNIRLLSITGQELYRNVISHAGGSSTQTLNVPAGLAAGIYKLEVVTPDKNSYTQKLILK